MSKVFVAYGVDEDLNFITCVDSKAMSKISISFNGIRFQLGTIF